MGFKGTEFDVVNFYEKANARFPPGLPKLGFSISFCQLMVDWSKGVDGERYIEVIKPIPTSSNGKKFELRRETLGAYDKGKAGLVLEEQTLLVDADTGDVYTKMVGSLFFVGQVLSLLHAIYKRAGMAGLMVLKNQVIKLQWGSNLIKSPSFERVLDKRCCIV
jgi:hypothetical protein